MKKLILIASILTLFVSSLCSCSSSSSSETDYSYNRSSYSKRYGDSNKKDDDHGWNKENWDRVTKVLQDEINKNK